MRELATMTELRLKLAPRSGDRIGLMGHVIADYPSPADVRAMIGVMAERGVEVIEIQIPFSEPMADGPLFLAANHAALKAGVTYDASRRLMAEASARHPGVRFVFMSYLNVVYRRGYGAFAQDAERCGAAGVLVPDLTFDLAGPLEAALLDKGLCNIRLAAPNASLARLQDLASGAQGMIYAVARRGVTGSPTSFGAEVHAFLAALRPMARVPLAVGFGVSSPDDIRDLRGAADFAVVGTASLRRFVDDGIQGFDRFWAGLAKAAL